MACSGEATRLWILSDLHSGRGDPFEFARVPDADVAVLAGDVGGTLVEALTWAARTIRPHMPVVMVAGDRDFHGEALADELARGQEAAAGLGIDLLENRTTWIAGLRFTGCTLWTDYDLYGATRRARPMSAAWRGMADHRSLLARRHGDGPGEPFPPEHALERHLGSVLFLQRALLSTHAHADRQVVVTHHAPHRRSTPSDRFGDRLTPAFATDLDGLLAAAQPALWVHGHTHASSDDRIRGTRLVCNPRDVGVENPAFDPAFVVEVGPG